MSTPDKTSDVFARSMIRVRTRIMIRFRVRGLGLNKPASILPERQAMGYRLR